MSIVAARVFCPDEADAICASATDGTAMTIKLTTAIARFMVRSPYFPAGRGVHAPNTVMLQPGAAIAADSSPVFSTIRKLYARPPWVP